MAMFSYRVKTHEGEVIDSSLQAGSRQEALSLIRQRVPGVVVQIREDVPGRGFQTGGPAPLPKSRVRQRGGRIRTTDLTTFFRQVAVSVNAGVSLRESLEAILEDLEHAKLRKVLHTVCQRLHEGSAFSLALTEHPKVFPPICLALIRAAEEAGTMAKTLDEMATTMEKSDALTRKIKSILAYPAFVAGFFVVVLLIMTIFILPQFQEIFSDWGASLPVLTQMVFKFNKFVIENAVVEVLLVVMLVVGFAVWRSTAVGRLQLDRIKLNAPAIGKVVQQVCIARFSKHFSMMVRGGVPIASAMEIAAAVSGNQVIERSLLAAREQVMLGTDIGSSLARQGGIFPRLLVRMVSIGESAGRLPEVLDKVSETYESRVEASIAVAMSLLEPVIIVFFGAVVLLFVLAIYMPVFTTASHMQ